MLFYGNIFRETIKKRNEKVKENSKKNRSGNKSLRGFFWFYIKYIFFSDITTVSKQFSNYFQNFSKNFKLI